MTMRRLAVLAVVLVVGSAVLVESRADDATPHYYVLECGLPTLQFGPFLQLHDCEFRKEIVSWTCPGDYPTPKSTAEHAARWRLLCQKGSEACHCARREGRTRADATIDQEITAFMDEPHGHGGSMAPLPGEDRTAAPPPIARQQIEQGEQVAKEMLDAINALEAQFVADCTIGEGGAFTPSTTAQLCRDCLGPYVPQGIVWNDLFDILDGTRAVHDVLPTLTPTESDEMFWRLQNLATACLDRASAADAKAMRDSSL
jgi:hypothetical protein